MKTTQRCSALFVTGVFALITSSADAQTMGGVTGTVIAKGIATSGNIVVSLEASGLAVSAPATPVEIDQKGKVFIPHVLPVVRGTTVRFLNNDRYGHNVFSPEGAYNLGTWRYQACRDHKFNTPGIYTQLCRLHPAMAAFVVVLDTPYFAVTTRAGGFTIANVRPGKYTLVAWGETLKPVRQPISIQAGPPATVSLTLTR